MRLSARLPNFHEVLERRKGGERARHIHSSQIGRRGCRQKASGAGALAAEPEERAHKIKIWLGELPLLSRFGLKP